MGVFRKLLISVAFLLCHIKGSGCYVSRHVDCEGGLKFPLGYRRSLASSSFMDVEFTPVFSDLNALAHNFSPSHSDSMVLVWAWDTSLQSVPLSNLGRCAQSFLHKALANSLVRKQKTGTGTGTANTGNHCARPSQGCFKTGLAVLHGGLR